MLRNALLVAFISLVVVLVASLSSPVALLMVFVPSRANTNTLRRYTWQQHHVHYTSIDLTAR